LTSYGHPDSASSWYILLLLHHISVIGLRKKETHHFIK